MGQLRGLLRVPHAHARFRVSPEAVDGGDAVERVERELIANGGLRFRAAQPPCCAPNVTVRVDEAWDDASSSQVDPLGSRRDVDFRGWPHSRDAALTDEDHGVVDRCATGSVDEAPPPTNATMSVPAGAPAGPTTSEPQEHDQRGDERQSTLEGGGPAGRMTHGSRTSAGGIRREGDRTTPSTLMANNPNTPITTK